MKIIKNSNKDYFEKRINANIVREKETRIAEIIVMVRKALGTAIDRTREETEVVLEETENAELEELVNVADSILEQQTIHPHNCQWIRIFHLQSTLKKAESKTQKRKTTVFFLKF